MIEEIKRENHRGCKPAFPKISLDDIKDKESGKSLIDILNSFNMYFLPYTGSRATTRKQLPLSQRRKGVWLTYVLYDDTVVAEFYNGDGLDDEKFTDSSNWIEGSNKLIGDVMLSSEGTWVINGKNTGIPARGENGITPIIKIIDNKYQVSYNKGATWELLDDSFVVTKFRVNNNRLEISYDFGENWSPCSDYIASWLRVNNNRLEISKDEQKTWEVVSDYLAVYIKSEGNKLWISKDKVNWEEASDYIATYFRQEGNKLQKSSDKVNWDNCSDYIAAWFRWSEDNKIQISRTNLGSDWQDLSKPFTNNIVVKGYVSNTSDLPVNTPLGSIYVVTTNDDGFNHLFVKTDSGWIDNGVFGSFAAEVVQESGDSTTEVMSQKAVTDMFNRYQRVFDGGRADTVYGGSRKLNCGGANIN